MPRFGRGLIRVTSDDAMHAKISRLPDSFTAVIALWPTVEAMAIDLQVHGQVVRQWRARNSIPSPFWAAILETKVARRERLTATLFVQLADRRKRRLPS